ncbi:hypothetical protein OG439_29940 [Amycolatopsis sp. NBC_01307]|uniref:hypothetical protein n=1 Tax=Amycolatopsis sp. NBC_01307 TaxID=2903561 RepID=UPI002E11B414|nr:hypothetical protein OG439_29940 [Amycolatopsis sp. NBC_01307]
MKRLRCVFPPPDRPEESSLHGLSARVETRYGRNDRVTVPRVLFLGVLALVASSPIC